MNIFAGFAQRVALEYHRRVSLSRNTREAEALRHEIWEIDEWSTQAARVRSQKVEALRRLEARIGGLETPDQILRRAGA